MDAPRLIGILWPAFLGACALETAVFALVDPLSLRWFGQPLELSRQGVYSLAFFAFWAVAALVGGMTLLLAQPDPGEPSGRSAG